MKDGEFINQNGVKFDYGTFCDYEQKYYSTTVDGVTVEFHGWNTPDSELSVLIDINAKRFVKQTRIRNIDSITASQLRGYVESAKRS